MTTATATIPVNLSNPFPGLRAFRTDESYLYFGRSKQVDEAIEKLLKHHFVGVIGASGLGKSSFVYCGILDTLTRQNPDEWQLCVSAPGESPLGNLAQSILGENKPLTEEQRELLKNDTQAIAQLIKEEHLSNEQKQSLEDNTQAIAELVKEKQQISGKKYLLFLDQFEELFKFAEKGESQEQHAKMYVESFINAFKQVEIPIYVILTMRSEFIGNCSRYPNLTENLNLSQFLIPQMTRKEKSEAIRNPVQLMGAIINDDVVEKILDDAGDNADQLPVMAHAMMRTWAFWQRNRMRESQPISLADYEAIGGVQRALYEHASETFSQLGEKERAICEKIFKTITERNSEGRKIRNPRKLIDICTITGYSLAEIAPVVEHFRKAGTGLLMPPEYVPLTENTKVDISHESMMRIWELLSTWVDDEADSVKLYLRIADASKMHHEAQSGLWRPPQLDIGQRWREENKPTKAWAEPYDPAFERAMAFLDFSQKQYDQEIDNKEKMQKRSIIAARRISIASIIAVVICVLFLLYALQQGEVATKNLGIAKEKEILANKNAKEAEKATKLAQVEQENAKKEAVKASKAATEALKAREDALESEKEAQNQALIAKQKELQASRAETSAKAAAKRAELQAQIANINQQLSVINSELADIAKQKAEISKRDVENLQMISIAKSMAIKSAKLADENQQVLVAQQASRMNEKFNGKPNDPDIYQGLYYGVKRLKSNKNPKYNQLQGHTQTVRALAGKNKMFSTSSDGKIIAWNTNNVPYTNASEIQPEIIANTNAINRALAVSPDGNILASAGEYNYIQIFKNGALQHKLPTKSKETWFLAFTANNKQLISVDNNKQVLLWDAENPETLPTTLVESDSKINNIAFDTNQNLIAIAKQTGKVTIMNLKGTIIKDFQADVSPIVSLAFSNSGNRLATGSENGMLRIWRMSGELSAPEDEQKEHRARINCIAFSKDGLQLATASFDKTVRIWNANNLNEIPIILDDHNDWVWSIAFTPDNNKLLAGCKDNVIRAWATHVKDMKDIICQDLQGKRTELERNEWKKFVKELNDKETVPCTCCN